MSDRHITHWSDAALESAKNGRISNNLDITASQMHKFENDEGVLLGPYSQKTNFRLV